ncbi:MAG: MFS transporter [Acidimicrobiales bacterium]|nr:MFS transporter [Acidimicrobiales bacterium]RZV46380.1 MAG: MFS transporter [Acidimicrobiales bacterium]
MTRRPDGDLLPFQIVMAVTAGAIGGIIAVLGELRDEFGFSETSIGVIVAAGFLASFVAQVGLARWADRGYAREMATIGVAVSAVSLLVMVFAQDVLTWSLSRAALGFAAGLTIPGLRRAASVLNPANVGENLARLVVGEVVGFILGPVVSAAFVVVGGIRAPFIAFAVGMVLFLPIVARLPADQGKLDESKRTTSFDLLRYRRLQGALTLVLGYFVMIGAFESVLPVMFQDRGGSAVTTGIAFTILAIPIALVSRFAGRTADRIGPPKVATAGFVSAAVVTLFFGYLPGLLVPILVMLVVGLADAFGLAGAQAAVARSVPEDRQAGALGLMGAAEVLGAGLAAIPAAMLYERSGSGPTWFTVGLIVLISVGLAHSRLHGTEPRS